MTEKIYIVFQEWQSKYGEREAQILHVTFDKDEAISVLNDEKAEIVANYHTPLEEMKNNEAFDIEDEPEHFYLNDFYGGWDEIKVIERNIKRHE